VPVAALALVVVAASGPDANRASAIAAEYARLARLPLWPGFDPARIPLAISDGERTWLFRHPSPPEAFAPVPGQAGTHVYEGRHPAVRANTSETIGDVRTATVLLTLSDTRAPADIARTAIHEAFHVFEDGRHPGWGGNEVDLFVYPVEDAAALASRRLESKALRRALAARERDVAVSWTKTALAVRGDRFARHHAVLGRAALTVSAGEAHPLFAGVRELIVTGLPAEPAVGRRDGKLAARAEGVAVELKDGTVERVEETRTLRLLAPIRR
jgi:hypothetical protein